MPPRAAVQTIQHAEPKNKFPQARVSAFFWLASAWGRTMTKRRPTSDSNRPYHRGSSFGPGRRRPMNRDERGIWRRLVHRHVRAGEIGPKGAWALELLPDYLSRDGRCDPSHARLAADAGVGESTVERALADAKAIGLLDWDRRLVRTRWRAEQTSNAYVLLVPGLGQGAQPPPPAPPFKSLNLESGYTVAVKVAGPLPGWEARFAAKIAEERRLRQARLVAANRERLMF